VNAPPGRMEGYTLLEMIAVLGLLGLIVSAAMTWSFHGIQGRKLQEQARMVSMLLKTARTEAIIQNGESAVEVDLSRNIFAIRGRSERLVLDKTLSLKLLTARQEVISEKGSIRFFRDGSSTGGTVMLSSGKRSASIVVDWLTGRIRKAR
jgi:general secretion pathway protein H